MSATDARLDNMKKLYEDATARVNGEPLLKKYAGYILADWPEDVEGDHLRWVLSANVSEIVAWAEAGQ